MPNYRYKCKKCGGEFDVSHSYHQTLYDVTYDKPCNQQCDAKEEDFFKVIGNVRTIFKGSGWAGKEMALKNSNIPEKVWDTFEKNGG